MSAPDPESLLTTAEVAELLQIHSKQVYRLVKQGLPGRRVGGDWRFVRREIMAWVEHGGSAVGAADEETPPPVSARMALPNASDALVPPFVAANGDLAIEQLLDRVNRGLPVLGFILADRDQAIRLLEQGAVLAAGSHGKGPPARLGDLRLARIHLVRREVGLVTPAGRKAPKLSTLAGLRFASRPPSAGVVTHLERAVRAAKLEMKKVCAHAVPMGSHRDVVCAVLRGEADVGLATSAWAHRAGLAFHRLATESYGLLVRANQLGDPRVVRLCEVAQSEDYRAALSAIPGYDPADAGVIRYDPE